MEEESESRGPIPGLEHFTGHLTQRAFARAQRVGASFMPPGRSARELGALGFIQQVGPLPQGKLGEMLGINRSTMVKLIDGLEADGLVERRREKNDMRNYALAITPKGVLAMPEMMRGAKRGEAKLLEPLTAPQQKQLGRLLQQLVPVAVAAAPPELASLSGFLLVRAHFALRAEATQRLAEFHITTAQFGLLSALHVEQPCAQQHLAEILGVSGPAVTGWVAELDEAGFVMRTRNATDRREQLLEITANGEALLEKAHKTVGEFHAELATKIGAKNLDALNQLLTKIG